MSMALAIAGRTQVNESDRAIALQLVEKNAAAIGLQPADIGNSLIAGSYIIPGSDIRMVYLQQSFKGMPVYNRLHVLAFRNEKVVSVAGSRIPALEQKLNKPDGLPGIDPVKAVTAALKNINTPSEEMIVPVSITEQGRKFEFGSLGVSTENIFAELLWYPVDDQKDVRLAWQVFVAPRQTAAYWMIRVDANTGEILNREDMTVYCNWGDNHTGQQPAGNLKKEEPRYIFNRDPKTIEKDQAFLINTATYRVVKYPAESPQHPGGTPALHTDPWLMSPGNATTLGWHDDGSVTYDSTRGNNAFAYDDRDANNLPGRSGVSTTAIPNLTFDFVPDFTLEPVIRTPVPNQQFNTTNLFYWNNLMHDLSYLYGFTETARNYQNSNMGRGGIGNDYVLAEAQDGSGTNNANFSSGAEGTRGRMQMFLWPSPTPDRDGDADNGVIAHEYTHGISNRMTGSGVGCLGNIEQMGEGWSDYLGLMITHNWATAVPSDGFNNPRGIGTWVLNQPVNGVGIRQYRYTTNMAINPLTYANLPTVAVPHGVGTIWCTTLWDMTWYIIQQAGINPNLFNPAGTGGNSIALKLVIEGLRLQPCSPGFIDGRNAILKADTLFFGAQYSCTILEAFARRGMGLGASQGSSSVRGDETITFVNGQAVFTTQPVSASACAGTNQTFTVAATGVNITYQWQLSTDGGATFNNIAGATSASYTISPVTLAMNNYQYRCIATGCPPPTTSNVAILSVFNSPAITSQPANVVVCENANASFSVTAGGTGNTYQWQLSTDGGANYTNISGATNSTLNLISVTAAMNNNRYRCIVSVTGCSTPATSNAGILTVNTAPAATAQPQAATLCVGGNNTFSITATGTGLTYQWQLSTDGGANYNNIAGATNSSYTVSGATAGMNNYRYRCIVSGTCAPALTSNAVILTVVSPVAITAQPTDAALCSGSNTSFTVTTTSSQPVSYQWQVSTNGGGTWTDIAGATTATLALNNVTTASNGFQYRVRVWNAACSTPANSAVATLTVRQLPSVTLSASPLTSLLPGQVTTLTATPSLSTGGTLTTSWFLNGNAVANVGNTRVVNVEQIGTYRVTVQETFTGGLVCSNQSTDVVIDAKVSNKLFIFPSPNDGRFTVSYYNNGGASTQRRIVVFSSLGQKVYEKQFPITGPYTLTAIDMRAAARGIYYVLVGDAAGNKLAEGKVHVH